MRIHTQMAVIGAIAVGLLAAPSIAAETLTESEITVEALGGLSIAPQICGLALDRAALAVLAGREGISQGALFEVNNRIASDQSGWSADSRRAYCAASAQLAEKMGLVEQR